MQANLNATAQQDQHKIVERPTLDLTNHADGMKSRESKDTKDSDEKSERMNSTTYTARQTRVLIVDDEMHIRLYLRMLLEKQGYQTLEARNGDEALHLIATRQPEIVLLDAMMPNMDGFTLLRALDLNGTNDSMAVFMITSLDDSATIDQAFALGVTDFFTKPINAQVLVHRLSRVAQQRRLERLRDDLVQMIVHDMRNPLTVIQGYSANLVEDPHNEASESWLQRIYFSSSQLLEMVMMILYVGKYREGQLLLKGYVSSIHERLHEVVETLAWFAVEKGIDLALDVPVEAANLTATLDWSLVQRAVGNLVSNAIKHSSAYENSPVRVTWSVVDGLDGARMLEIQVSDHGEGIAPQDQSRIFEKYGQVNQSRNQRQTDIGIGLTFCRIVVEMHGGTIRVASELGKGAIFTLTFRLDPMPDTK